MESVLKKIQWHYNIDNLREIDDDTVDDDVRLHIYCTCTSTYVHMYTVWCIPHVHVHVHGEHLYITHVQYVHVYMYMYVTHVYMYIVSQDETEWQGFLRQSLEFVGKVAELFPGEAFQMIVSSTTTHTYM